MARAARPRTLVLSPDDPVGVAVRAVVRFHTAAFVREEAAARAGDVEGVHQLRVATRRLRAALRFFGPTLPPAAVTQAEAELASMADVIGAVRDLDVLAATVARRARRVEPVLRDGERALEEAIRERREPAQQALTAALDSPKRRTLLARLDAIAGAPPRPGRSTPLIAVAPTLLAPLLRAVRDAGRHVDAKAKPARLHRLRVRAKRLRYALETLRGLGGKRLATAVAELTRLQELLGEHQDMVVAMAWLQTNVPDDASRATLLATGALVQVLGRRARRLRRRSPAAWSEVERRVLRHDLLGAHAPLPRPVTRHLHVARA